MKLNRSITRITTRIKPMRSLGAPLIRPPPNTMIRRIIRRMVSMDFPFYIPKMRETRIKNSRTRTLNPTLTGNMEVTINPTKITMIKKVNTMYTVFASFRFMLT